MRLKTQIDMRRTRLVQAAEEGTEQTATSQSCTAQSYYFTTGGEGEEKIDCQIIRIRQCRTKSRLRNYHMLCSACKK